MTMAAAIVASAASAATAGEEKFDWSQLIQPPAQPEAEQNSSFNQFTEALTNEAYSEAEVVAKQMIEQVDPNAAAERARALHNLAVAQQAQGSHDSAMQNYVASIDVITRNENNLSSSLIMPLRGLAQVYLDRGLQDEANAALDRALHVSNVNYGPHSLNQLPILNERLDAALEFSDPESALDLMDRIHALYTRKYPRDSQELLPMYRQEAELYNTLGMGDEEYNAWRHVLTIQRKLHGKNDLSLIEPHLRLAEVRIRNLMTIGNRKVAASSAAGHLKKALRIAEDSPGDNWQARKNCLLSLADFYTLFGMQGRARRYYAEAWDLLTSDEMYRPSLARDLEVPVALVRQPPNPYANFAYDRKTVDIDPDEYLEGEMVMAFTVTAEGRTRDIRLVESDPEDFELMERRVRNSVERFVYRPRIADRVPVPTADQYYRIKFYYVPSAYEVSIARSNRRGPN